MRAAFSANAASPETCPGVGTTFCVRRPISCTASLPACVSAPAASLSRARLRWARSSACVVALTPRFQERNDLVAQPLRAGDLRDHLAEERQTEVEERVLARAGRHLLRHDLCGAVLRDGASVDRALQVVARGS
jgi:hypothetical protein